MTPEEKSRQKASADFVMPFGIHKGSTLREIALIGDVLHLDRVVDAPWISTEARQALKDFLALDWVGQLVDQHLEDQEEED